MKEMETLTRAGDCSRGDYIIHGEAHLPENGRAAGEGKVFDRDTTGPTAGCLVAFSFVLPPMP